MRSCLIGDLTFDSGLQRIESTDSFMAMIRETEIPRENDMLLACIFKDDTAALQTYCAKLNG